MGLVGWGLDGSRLGLFAARSFSPIGSHCSAYRFTWHLPQVHARIVAVGPMAGNQPAVVHRAANHFLCYAPLRRCADLRCVDAIIVDGRTLQNSEDNWRALARSNKRALVCVAKNGGQEGTEELGVPNPVRFVESEGEAPSAMCRTFLSSVFHFVGSDACPKVSNYRGK